jgi:hypothetical protein
MAGKPEKQHIFISYKRKEPDKGFTHRLANDLRAAGHPIWMDIEGINPGAENWERKIQAALDSAYAFVVIMSPDSVASEWVNIEIHRAREVLRGRIYPVMFRKVKPPLSLTLVQHIDFTDEANYKTALARLLESLPEPLRSGPHLPKGVEEALMSQSAHVREGGYKALIEIARGSDAKLVPLARERLERVATDHFDSKMKDAARKYLNEVKAEEARKQAAEEARKRQEEARKQQEEATRKQRETAAQAALKAEAAPTASAKKGSTSGADFVGGALVAVLGLGLLIGIFAGIGSIPFVYQMMSPFGRIGSGGLLNRALTGLAAGVANWALALPAMYILKRRWDEFAFMQVRDAPIGLLGAVVAALARLAFFPDGLVDPFVDPILSALAGSFVFVLAAHIIRGDSYGLLRAAGLLLVGGAVAWLLVVIGSTPTIYQTMSTVELVGDALWSRFLAGVIVLATNGLPALLAALILKRRRDDFSDVLRRALVGVLGAVVVAFARHAVFPDGLVGPFVDPILSALVGSFAFVLVTRKLLI